MRDCAQFLSNELTIAHFDTRLFIHLAPDGFLNRLAQLDEPSQAGIELPRPRCEPNLTRQSHPCGHTHELRSSSPRCLPKRMESRSGEVMAMMTTGSVRG